MVEIRSVTFQTPSVPESPSPEIALQETVRDLQAMYQADERRYPNRGGLSSYAIEALIEEVGAGQPLTPFQSLELIEVVLYDLGARKEQDYFAHVRPSESNTQIMAKLEAITGIKDIATELITSRQACSEKSGSNYSPGLYLATLANWEIDFSQMKFTPPAEAS